MAIHPPLARKLRMGLVGGGFIGRVHALAAALDRQAVLVAGALSSDPAKAQNQAAAFGIAPERAYPSYQALVAGESRLCEGERIDFVSIATPNHLHFEIAKTFAEAGFHVFCDKPMTLTLDQAIDLAHIVSRSKVVFVLTHNYSGYPLVRQARAMVQAGELGTIQAIRVAYLQGSLRRQRTPEQQRRFAWKMDPNRAGDSGCFGDIGVHAYHLCRYITGLLPERLSCTFQTFEPLGPLDDYGTAILQFQGGALGTITASRISHGRENGLRIEIDGTAGSLEWHQEEPNRLVHRVNGRPLQVLSRDPGASYLGRIAKASCRLPAGHPEAFLQGFANLYTAAYPDIFRRLHRKCVNGQDAIYPTVGDGVDGMNFITQCVASSLQGGAWQSMMCPLLSP
jgi:predicted dehydrogenase